MKKTYFASDFHLGINARLTSREREQQVVRWLDDVSKDAEAIYLVGDIFDYWFTINRNTHFFREITEHPHIMVARKKVNGQMTIT